MRRILVSYDLVERVNYSALEHDLERLKAVRVLQSVWCLPPTLTSANSLFNRLKAHISADARIIVVEFSNPENQNLLNPIP